MGARIVTAGGRDHRVRTAGSGPAVVLVPSLGRGGDDFDVLASALHGAGMTTVAIDPPGVGTPLPLLAAADLRETAEDLWTVVDQIGCSHVGLVGHAYGNRLVRMASAIAPDRVDAIALLACGGDVEPSQEAWDALARSLDDGLDPEAHLAAVAEAFFAPGNDPAPWRDGWWPAVAAQQAAATGATDHAELWAGGTAPLLVVQGAQDRIAVPANAARLAAGRPGARVVLIDGCGHAMLPEQPTAIAAALVPFLTDHLLDR